MRESWQDVLDRFHYGIYLITVAADGGYNGMIASWVTQWLHEPPLVGSRHRRAALPHPGYGKPAGSPFNLRPGMRSTP